MRPNPAVLGLLKDEGEGVIEFLAGAEPNKMVQARINLAFEFICIQAPCLGVQPIGCDNNIALTAKFFDPVRRYFGFIGQCNADLACPFLKE